MYRRPGLQTCLRRLSTAQSRSFVTEADVSQSRKYCLEQLRRSDYDAYLIRTLVPPRTQDVYTALRALNLELVRLPDTVSNPIIGQMRMRFWLDSLEATFEGRPPKEPVCVLLHAALDGLRGRLGDEFAQVRQAVRFWVVKVARARERRMDNRPYASLAALEEHAESTYSTMMYALLAALPLRSVHLDHLASHIGKAAGIAAAIRGIPVLAAPPRPVKGPQGTDLGSSGAPVLLLPLDVMAQAGVREEDVFRLGPGAPGLADAVFAVATRANDHLITARGILENLKAGKDAGHEYEHGGEAGHEDDGEDPRRVVSRGFGVLLEAVTTRAFLESLEKQNFDVFGMRRGNWTLPWKLWQALRKERL